jgi:hypothetical protein
MDKPSSGSLTVGVGSWAGVEWIVGATGTVVVTEPVSDVSEALVVGCVVAVGNGVEIVIVAGIGEPTPPQAKIKMVKIIAVIGGK